MSFEVVYTSARRGLREGASGFCTVAATEGIPRLLHQKLESLSGYRHTEVTAGRPLPVNYSHVTVRLQRNFYHVVSRISDAGIDYSGRTNKIAHHLALTSSELSHFPDGPAALLLDDSYWYSEWNGSPQNLPPDRLPHSVAEHGNAFATWEQVFGDSGWAGILGRAASDGMQTVSVIVPAGRDTMSLLNEALQLVPRHFRWKICFSTYFSQQAPGTTCHWRFVIDGTRESRKLRARSPGILVDPLESSGGVPEDDPFVDAVRNCTPEAVHSFFDAPQRSRLRPMSREGGEGRVTVRRRRPVERQERRPTSPFLFDEEETNDDDEEWQNDTDTRSPRRGTPSKTQVIWLVLGLLLTVVVILGVIAFRRLS